MSELTGALAKLSALGLDADRDGYHSGRFRVEVVMTSDGTDCLPDSYPSQPVTRLVHFRVFVPGRIKRQILRGLESTDIRHTLGVTK
jgi:hypothetical protein